MTGTLAGRSSAPRSRSRREPVDDDGLAVCAPAVAVGAHAELLRHPRGRGVARLDEGHERREPQAVQSLVAHRERALGGVALPPRRPPQPPPDLRLAARDAAARYDRETDEPQV